MAICNIDALLLSGRCFQCYDEHQSQMAMLQLLCDISVNGGGGGGGSIQVLQGTGAPSSPPTNAAIPALYTDLSTGVIYTWNVVTQAWF